MMRPQGRWPATSKHPPPFRRDRSHQQPSRRSTRRRRPPPRRAWPPPFRWLQHPVLRRRRVRSLRRPSDIDTAVAEYGAAVARFAATVRCCHNPKQQCRRQCAPRSAAIGDARRRVCAIFVGRSASCGGVGVRRLEHGGNVDPGLGTVSDEELEDGYGSLDRATLLLVDARHQGDSDELLFVLVANERAGAQTTLYCAQSAVSSTGLVQPRSAIVLQRSSGTSRLADVQANPAVVDFIRDQCAWR